ncbi:MAG: hydroxyacid dehydrogenase [Ignavibacteria bacterium]|jgi:phosphoglycerate dehydrogenase-like enzyme|nr:hydroxyacid dehydrogenase [Ignavibacteria bacterium]
MNIVAVEPIGIKEDKYRELKEKFQNLGHNFLMFSDRQESDEILIERLKDAEIAIISNIKLTKDVMSHCPKLKMLSVAFTGVDHIDLDYCRSANISVCNASGYATEAVSELALALMLNVYRNIVELDNKTRCGEGRDGFLGRQIHGKTVGIVGTGAIGCRTASILRNFSCKVVAWSRTKKQELINSGVEYISLEELLTISDIISLHLPLNKDTYHIISEEKLRLCKPDAILINTARGDVVDMQALAFALKNKKIAGAGIDVFEKEPPLPKDHLLLNLPNCIVTPHVAYATEEAFAARIDIVVNNIESWLAGKAINLIV